METAQWVFTNILAPVRPSLHSQYHSTYQYIGSIFHSGIFAASSLAALTTLLSFCIRFSLQLAEIHPWATSDAVPSQSYAICACQGIIYFPPATVTTTVRAVKKFCSSTEVFVLCPIQITDIKVSCHALIPMCNVFVTVQGGPWHDGTCLVDHISMKLEHPSKMISLSCSMLRAALEFWSTPMNISKGFSPIASSVTILSHSVNIQPSVIDLGVFVIPLQ